MADATSALFFVFILVCAASSLSVVQNDDEDSAIVFELNKYDNIVRTTLNKEYNELKKGFPFADFGQVEKRRHRRSVRNYNLSITDVNLNTSHIQLRVHWAGKGSDVIVALGVDGLHTNSSSLHVSNNYGKSFTSLKLHFYDSAGKRHDAVIQHFYRSPVRISYYVMTDTKNGVIFLTRDYFRHTHYHKVSFSPDKIYFHPTDLNILLAFDTRTNLVYKSTTFGSGWTMIATDVLSLHWASKDVDPHSVYIQKREPRSTILVKTNLTSLRTVTLTENVYSTRYIGRYIFVMKKLPAVEVFPDRYMLYQLWVSKDQGPFVQAKFGMYSAAQDFYVADAQEESVFLCVMFNDTTNLYVSDVSGTRYSLSLHNVVYFNPSIHSGSLLQGRATKPFADITRIEGLKGVYIASLFPPNKDQVRTEQSTMITFDKGGEWRSLNAPAKDRYGNSIHCHMNTKCSLHLSQMYNFLFPFTRTNVILSSANAPGLLIGTGTTGQSLKHEVGVYVSSDGGLKWREVERGNYVYEMADHGGLIVMVEKARAVTHFSFSWDEGRTWQRQQFINTPMRIIGILTEPGEKTTMFSVFGSTTHHFNWHVVQLNLTAVFSRTCSRKDYTEWSLYLDKRECLMGRKVVFERRIPNIPCLNGLTYTRGVIKKNCTCTREDYECDFGYIENDSTKTRKCIPTDHFTFKPPSPCPPHTTYLKSRGYRRVPEDSCHGGDEYLYEPYTYYCPTKEQEDFILYSIGPSINSLNLADTSRSSHLVATATSSGNPASIAFDYHGNCVYWISSRRNTIQTWNRQTKIVSALPHTRLTSLAYDWVGRNIMWMTRKSIHAARFNGSFSRTLR